jgi:cell division protein FtsQ
MVAAHNMTTLNVQTSKLRTAVAPFPVVKDVQVSTSFPHGIRIRVIEQIPVATITSGGQRMTVAGNGTLLRDVAPSRSLPSIPVPVLPGGNQLTNTTALQAVAVLAAAPYQLLNHVEAVTTSAGHGVTVRLRNGPSLYFGDRELLTAKWIAAAGVLADPGSAGASYIDVTDPQRPAAGVVGAVSSTAVSSTASSTGAASSTGTASSTGAGSTGTAATATAGGAIAGNGTAGTAPSTTSTGG